MKKNKDIFCQDINLFNEELQGIQKIKQDKVFHKKKYINYMHNVKNTLIDMQYYHSKFFTKNIYNTQFIKKNPVSFIREKSFQPELLKLKKKYYTPEIILDVHGLNQEQVKLELGKLIFICHTEKIFCFAIIHGHGKNILKNNIPIWLSQHPDIIVFYQVPKQFGYNTTLFVLIKTY